PIYNGRILNLRKDEVLLPNGKTADREVIEHNGGSAILCVKDNKIVLVKQYRYPIDEITLEIPAGKLNKGEDAKETAIRELKEEAGLKAKDVELIFTMYPTPAYDTETTYIYLAKEFTKSSQNLDEDEFLTASWYDLDEVNLMIEKGQIKDAKTIIAILYALNKLALKKDEK
ncbi:MAG: NUDIX hydrolase, partial [Firmicutes bacterium]|nr:NUDIX hydrolase [Candidatus Caballimonas caccae]